jgi:hypothetical protein
MRGGENEKVGRGEKIERRNIFWKLTLKGLNLNNPG